MKQSGYDKKSNALFSSQLLFDTSACTFCPHKSSNFIGSAVHKFIGCFALSDNFSIDCEIKIIIKIVYTCFLVFKFSECFLKMLDRCI